MQGFLLASTENDPEFDSGRGCTTLNILKATELSELFNMWIVPQESSSRNILRETVL